MMFPFVWQIIMSLSTNAEVQSVTPHLWPKKIQWGNYSEVFHQLPFMQQLRNSVVITVIRVLAQIAFCTLAGYAFARMHFRGKTLVLGAVLSILMVPPRSICCRSTRSCRTWACSAPCPGWCCPACSAPSARS